MSSVAAVGPAMRRRNSYARAVGAILRHLRERLDHVAEAPVIGLFGAEPEAGVTTLALSLAHAACNEGERVLLIERSGGDWDLREFAQSSPTRSGAMRVLRRDERDGGEILCLPAQDEIDVDAALDAAGAVDLVLVDYGAPRRLERALRDAGTSDGAVLVCADGAEPRLVARLTSPLAASGLLLATVATGALEDGG